MLTLALGTLPAKSSAASPGADCAPQGEKGTLPIPGNQTEFLDQASEEIAIRTLKTTFCEDPKDFCSSIRDLATGTRRAPQAPAGTSIEPVSRFLSVANLESPSGLKEATAQLRALGSPDQPLIQPLYEGAPWKRATLSFEIARKVLLDRLSDPALGAPEVVLEKIRNLKLINPFDPNLPIEKRKELYSGCRMGQTWDTPSSDQIGVFNGFASPGGVVLCPGLLLTMNDEALMTTLLHEISHLIGPCLVGMDILNRFSAPDCRVSAETRPEIAPWLKWMEDTRRLESCFQNAGLNEGSDAQWIARVYERNLRANPSSSAEENCNQELPTHLRPSKIPTEGLLSSCDISQYKVVIQMMNTFDQIGLELSSTQGPKKLARSLQLGLRRLWTAYKIELPDTNQFNEALSDTLAGSLIEKALREYRQATADTSPLPDPKAFLSGLSMLCSETKNWKLKGEAHSRDDRRMQILSSQAALRSAIGCESPIPIGLTRRLSRCQGLGVLGGKTGTDSR